MTLLEYDIVRVRQLLRAAETYDELPPELEGRPPVVGDEGTIVMVLHNDDVPHDAYIVENVGRDGMTIWLATFAAEELELVLRP